VKAIFLLCLTAAIAAAARPAMACSKAELDTFAAAAQALDSSAVATGQRLVRCAGLGEPAVQWLAFLLDKTGHHAESLKVDGVLVQKSGRDGVIARARGGNGQELLHLVDEQDPAYTTAADAQLVLARVLTRKAQFGRGRDAYQMYLKVRPDDDAAETERLYSYIWEGTWSEAEAQFLAAEHWSGDAAFKSALARGRALIAKQAPKAQTMSGANSNEEGGLGGEFRGAYELYRTPSYYDRRTLGVGYRGLLDLRLATHTINDLGLTQTKANASEVLAGATLGQTTSWYLAAHGGYFSLGSDHYTGDLSVGVPLGGGVMVEAGTSQVPLALQMPLTPDASGLMRDSVYLQLRVLRWLQLRGELQKERNYKPHEAHLALGRLPLRQKDGDELALVAALRFESFPQPIADYDTDLRTLTTGAGFSLDRRFASGWRLASQATYSFSFVTQRDPSRHTKQVGVFDASADAILPLDELLHALISAHYVRAQNDEYVQRHHLNSSVLIGIGYGDAERH